MALRLIGISLVLVLCVAWSDALTTAEIAQFKTTGQAEKNTGIVGWVKVATSGTKHVITSNGIPDHTTGTFPAKSNPNSIAATNFRLEIPTDPTTASEASCLPMGSVGVATNGVALFNPYNADVKNAVEGDTAEVFDSCNGHPEVTGQYHYHQEPNCLPNVGNASQFIGVANDGFPIYSIVDENGKTLTSADLDKCHGRYVDGKYRYHITKDFPYIMGCFMGTPLQSHPDHCYFAIASGERARIHIGLLLLSGFSLMLR